MSHETPAGLEEPLPQARQGPALDGDGQGEPSQAIAQVVGRARGGHAALGAPTNPNFFGVPEPVGGLRQFPQSCAVDAPGFNERIQEGDAVLSAILEDRSPQKQSNGSSAPVSYCCGLVRSSVRSEPPSSSDQVSGARFRCSPVEKFNDQEMDDRTLKVEITKSGGAGGKDGGYRSSGGRSGRYYIGRSAGASLTTPSSPVSRSPAGGAQGRSAAGSAGRYGGDATFQISSSRLGVLARMIGQEDRMFTMPFRKLEREQGCFPERCTRPGRDSRPRPSGSAASSAGALSWSN
jgi:hypothetical protein